jgi:hypothetical protein
MTANAPPLPHYACSASIADFGVDATILSGADPAELLTGGITARRPTGTATRYR